MQNTFCKALSNAISFRIPGNGDKLTFNPCCLFDEYVPFSDERYEHERTRYINATSFNDMPECKRCALKEQTHVNAAGIFKDSRRLISNRQIPNGIGENIWKLEIVLDTTCNAACIQCSGMQSSLWRKQMFDQETDVTKKIHHIQPELQIDQKVEIIKSKFDIQQVKWFHFWGGEPLLTDTHLKFLRDVEDLSDVTLQYTTNCSIFPDDEVLRIWEKCKKVFVAFSVDGVGDKFHYIRWPLKWDKAVDNFKRFKEFDTGNMVYHVNCCVLPLNVLEIPRLEDFAAEYFHSNIKYIRGEGVVDIMHTPMALREQVYKTLGENHVVSNILQQVAETDSYPMLQHLAHWDRVRKLEWREVFPEISPYFPPI